VAKYSCKASHEQITSRDSDPDRWRDRGVPEQLVQMAAATIRLSERLGLRGIGGWVHMLGFRGHFVTKSRGYSTKLARCAPTAPQQDEPDQAGDVHEEDSTEVVGFWQYLGSGYLNPGDVLLAAGVEASLRAAREALLELRRGPRVNGRNGPSGNAGCEIQVRGESCLRIRTIRMLLDARRAGSSRPR
jgi:hypothetical protein